MINLIRGNSAHTNSAHTQCISKSGKKKLAEHTILTTTKSYEENKLRSYCKVKENYELENYLQINTKPRHAKIAFTKLRISSHSLVIETGRHHKPNKIPANERYCRQCDPNRNKIEDENTCYYTATDIGNLETSFILKSILYSLTSLP